MQSAYRKHHSTEIALLRVVHDILLDRFRHRYGFCEMVLRWIESYLKDRPQCIALDMTLPQPRCLICGVPQRSVLGSLLFSLYIAPVRYHLRTRFGRNDVC